MPLHASRQQCDICESHYQSKDGLSLHKPLHLAGFRCTRCAFTTTLKLVISAHVQAHGADEQTFGCRACGRRFDTRTKYNYHKSMCRQDKPQCDCCGKVFANKLTLRIHLRGPKAENTNGKDKQRLVLPCKGCDKVFYTKKSYRAHVVIHDGIKHPCPICGKLFMWKRNLARHLRNHRERETGALHECRQCGKKYASRECYNNHMKFSKKHVTEESYEFECHYCGKKFPTKYSLNDHVDWEHLKRIKYQCSVCFKVFKTSKIMVAHMNNIHEGKKSKEPEGSHLCDICGRSYTTVKRLKGHVWAMHTTRSTSKSFKCKLCPATFTWQTSIYKHVKMMHDNPRRGFKQARSLQPKQKLEPYAEIELNRAYFEPTFSASLVQNMVPANGVSHNVV